MYFLSKKQLGRQSYDSYLVCDILEVRNISLLGTYTDYRTLLIIIMKLILVRLFQLVDENEVFYG